MARGDIAEELEMSSPEVTTTVKGEGPVARVQRLFKENVHQANRWAKRILVRKVKQKLKGGVPDEGYAEEYAEDKNANAYHREASAVTYSETGPVDFRYSGRLWNELVGRGRAKPSEPSLQIWLALKHPNRKHPNPRNRSGGSSISYRELAQELRRTKSGLSGDPFSPSRRGRDQIAQKVARRLLDLEG